MATGHSIMAAAPGARFRRLYWPLAAVGAAFVLLLHVRAWPTATPDMHDFLLPWYSHILEHGPVGAFSHPFSNYTPTYLYFLAAASLLDPWLSPMTVIKLVSVAGTACLAGAVRSLLQAAGARHAGEAALLVFLLPTPLLNAAFLGQCDAFWVAACAMAVAAALRERTAAMLVWCGVAVAFKAQAAFLAPFVFAVLLQRRAPLHQWLIPPAVFAAAMAPAWLAGWPAYELLMVYPRQSGTMEFAGNLSNPWAPLHHLLADGGRGLFWFGYAAALAAACAYTAGFARRRWSAEHILAGALLSALMLPFLLPKMHERYLLLADILAFALAAKVRDRDTVTLALLVQLASVLAIFSYTTHWPLPVSAGALLSALALVRTLQFLQERPGDARTAAP